MDLSVVSEALSSNEDDPDPSSKTTPILRHLIDGCQVCHVTMDYRASPPPLLYPRPLRNCTPVGSAELLTPVESFGPGGQDVARIRIGGGDGPG